MYHMKSHLELFKYVQQCGDGCRTIGDTIDIYLDLQSDNKCFAFGLKGNYHGAVETAISEGEYCLHVTFGVKGIVLEIIDFEAIESLPQKKQRSLSSSYEMPLL